MENNREEKFKKIKEFETESDKKTKAVVNQAMEQMAEIYNENEIKEESE